MPVRQIERYMRPASGKQVCGENNTLIKGEGGEEGLHLLGLRTEIGIAAFGGVALLPFYDVVVAVEKIQPLLLIELFEQPKHIAVHVNDILHISVFPKFIPVTQLDIGKALPIIMFQRGKVQMLVFQKIVGRVSHTSMAVTYQDIAGAVGEGQQGSVLESSVKTRGNAHNHPSLRWRL